MEGAVVNEEYMEGTVLVRVYGGIAVVRNIWNVPYW
jgi:hypothetical protein